jgi:hypothetical protein
MNVLKFVILVTAVLALVTLVRANTRMLRRAREGGRRYWLINPMSTIAALQGPEIVIFVAALAVLGACFLGLMALQ